MNMRKFRPVAELYQEQYGHLPCPATVTQMKKKGLRTARIAGKTCTTEDYLRAHVEGEPQPLSAAAQADNGIGI